MGGGGPSRASPGVVRRRKRSRRRQRKSVAGLDQERGPAPAGEEGAQGCQQGAIGVIEGRPVYLAAQDGELVAEHQDLDVFGVGSAQAENDEGQGATHGSIQKTEGHRPGSLVDSISFGQPELRGTDDGVPAPSGCGSVSWGSCSHGDYRLTKPETA